MKNILKLVSMFLVCQLAGFPVFAGVTINPRDGAVIAEIDGKPVLAYQADHLQQPEGMEDIYSGSGFIHSLHSPAGAVLTAHFPIGHSHQQGIFSAWAQATFNHEVVSFWNKHLGTGTTAHVSVDGVNAPGFEITREQASTKSGRAITEKWEVKLHGRSDIYVIDIHLKQEPATTKEVLLHEYHYGGFAFRGCENWNEDAEGLYEADHAYLTGKGTTDRTEANHERPGWVCIHGPVNGKTAGVVIMDHPANFRYPQPVRVHPKMPYFVFTPVVEGSIVLEPGFIYQARYRLITFDGEPDPEKIASWYSEYIEDSSVIH